MSYLENTMLVFKTRAKGNLEHMEESDAGAIPATAGPFWGLKQWDRNPLCGIKMLPAASLIVGPYLPMIRSPPKTSN